MASEKQRLHRIRVRAFFLSEQRQRDGTPGSPESDWLAAEWEEDRRIENHKLYCRLLNVKDSDVRARLSVLRHISDALVIRVGDITEETPLPQEGEARRRLGQNVGWEAIGDIFEIPDDVTTVGALIIALRETPPVVRQRRVSS